MSASNSLSWLTPRLPPLPDHVQSLDKIANAVADERDIPSRGTRSLVPRLMRQSKKKWDRVVSYREARQLCRAGACSSSTQMLISAATSARSITRLFRHGATIEDFWHFAVTTPSVRKQRTPSLRVARSGTTPLCLCLPFNVCPFIALVPFTHPL